MRGFFATIPLDLDAADAAVVIAEAELIDAWNRHAALFDAVEALGEDVAHNHPLVTEALRRMEEAGARLARLPASGLSGVAVKLHHLALEVLEGRTAWAEPLARQALADARNARP